MLDDEQHRCHSLRPCWANPSRLGPERVAGQQWHVPSLPENLPPLEPPSGPSLVEPLPPDRPVRWGILATGKIATDFATDLALVPEACLAAVGARRLESAREFADRFDAPAAYGSYQELVEDPAVDVVYVATPHALHKEHVLRAFEAGKRVLCEKALTLTADDAEELVRTAREKQLFFMEAMWMRCNPLIRRVQQLVHSGAVGTVRQVRADLGFVVDKPPTDRLLDPALGGGTLLDMGVYPLTFAQLLLGEPSQVTSAGSLSPSGADLNVSLSLGYDSGAVASLSTTMTAWSPRTASVATDLGRLDLPAPFHHPPEVTWHSEDVTETLREDLIGTGLGNEAAEVVRCLRNGELESPLVPLDETVALMRLTDRIRAQLGVVYDADRQAAG
jgi:predicted dehydrogenase